MDRGNNAAIRHDHMILSGITKNNWYKRDHLKYEGKRVDDIIISNPNIMTEISLAEAISLFRGKEGRLLTKSDLLPLCSPPNMTTFLSSAWGQELTPWSASFLGISDDDVGFIQCSDQNPISNVKNKQTRDTFGSEIRVGNASYNNLQYVRRHERPKIVI
jgi:hypothetical protein